MPGRSGVDLGRVVCDGIDLVGRVEPGPFEAFPVLFVTGAGKDVDEVAVSPDAAAVLGRAGAAAGEATRVGDSWVGVVDGLDDDVVFPVVADVVGVA